MSAPTDTIVRICVEFLLYSLCSLYRVNGILCNDLIPKSNFCLSCSHVQDFQKCNGRYRVSIRVYPSFEHDCHALSLVLLSFIETLNMTLFPAFAVPEPEPCEAMDDDPISHSPNPDRHSYQEALEEYLSTSDHIPCQAYFDRMK